MLVKEWMTPNPVCVDEETSMMKVGQLMKENNVRRLPVLRKDKLVGMVTDRDIRSASPSQATSLDVHELYYLLSQIKIKEIMARKLITISPDQTVIMAAVLMLKNRISGLPVVDHLGKLVGIVTQGDIYKILVELSGIYQGKTLFAFHLEDRPGSIKEVADVVREYGGRFASILTAYTAADPKSRRVYIRIRDIAPDKLEALKKELEKKFVLLYMVTEDVNSI
jgi:acetoin utilization protein AcuB